MTRHVIVGSGPAGLNALETIRQFDRDASITLISDEPAYSRMALPYFLSGRIEQEQLATGSAQYFDRLGVESRIGRRVARIDGAARTVHLDGGEALSFDTLLVATGSSPLRPAIPGADGPHVHTLWTLADALAVLASVRTKRPSVVLVGGGFIGLIILNALLGRGWKVSLVEQENHVLPRMLDRRGAGAAESWLRARGVDVYTGCGVREIGGTRKKTVALTDGTTLTAHVVILSTGVQPNVGFLEGSGIELDRGVLVDDTLQTSRPGVYAAGDVAQGPDLLGGPRAVHAIQPTAVDHGRIAGANMAGAQVAYPGSLSMNILDVAGLHCASFGQWMGDGDTTTVWNAGRSIYRKLVWDGTRLAGAIIMGPVEDSTMLTDVGMIKGLVQSRLDLGDWKGYVHERPWDLRRAYISSCAPAELLPQTRLGRASAARAYRFNDLGPRAEPGPYHAQLAGTRPAEFDSLPPTPTPGIHKG